MTEFRPLNGVARIQKIVAQAYGLDPILMRQHDRRRNVAWPRQVAMFLAREQTGKSLPHLGRLFGGFDHSTVWWAIRSVEARMGEIAACREEIKHLRKKIRRNHPHIPSLHPLADKPLVEA